MCTRLLIGSGNWPAEVTCMDCCASTVDRACIMRSAFASRRMSSWCVKATSKVASIHALGATICQHHLHVIRNRTACLQ
jgi:hypothetical protein